MRVEKIIAQLIATFSSVLLATEVCAVSLGQIDDFEDTTVQGWVEGAPSPNPPTNVAGGPPGSTRYLQDSSAGGVGAGSNMTLFNQSQWTGDFLSAGITRIRAMVRVDPGSDSALSLRVGFRSAAQAGARGYASLTPVVVPNDGNWYEVVFPIESTDLGQFNTGVSYASTMSNVGHMRIFHKTTAGWQGDDIVATMGIDNIEALESPTNYQGWLWETSAYGSGFGVDEENCFGQIDLLLNPDSTWTVAAGEEVCRGRHTQSNSRTLVNSPPFATSVIEAQSTRPLLSAGGNLFEAYGEDVLGGIGQGEERLATLLAEPSGEDLIILGGTQTIDLPDDLELSSFVHVLAKATPAVVAARVANDLQNTTWRTAIAIHSVSQTDVNTETSAARIQTLNLQPGGVCSYTTSGIFPDFVKNRDSYFATQFSTATNLDNRGVQAGVSGAEFTNCTYSIDVDGYLAISVTQTFDSAPGNPQALNFRYVVSDDNQYLVPGPAASGVDANPQVLLTGFRAASALPANSIDGNYLFYMVLSEYAATGTFHSTGSMERQEFDFRGRGLFTFDSQSAGNVPAGETGTWFGCEATLVQDGAELGYSGDYGLGTAFPDAEISSESINLTSCDYRLDADGGLLVHITNLTPGEPVPFEATFRGYVNSNAEVFSLTTVLTDPDPTTFNDPEDAGSVFFFLGMEYTGNPNLDDDGDQLTNLEEFQFPVPPGVPLLLRRSDNGRWHGYELDGSDISNEGGVDLTFNLAWQVKAVDDFDGDNRDDVLMRRTDNQRWYMYLLNGLNIVEEGGVFLATSPNWNIASVGDYNGDGRSDLLMRNGDNRHWRIRLMDGRSILETGPADLPLDLSWDVVASRDFDGDGADDILIRNSVNGRWKMYLMNGTSIKESALLSLAVVDIWLFQAADDFTGDGQADVLVRRSDNGLWRLYTMNGTLLVSTDLINLPTGASWRLESAHDFNADGRTDVLLRNTVTEQWQLNLLNGPTVSASGMLAIPANPSLVLQVVDDFDADNDADLLTRNSVNGQWKLYSIDGTAIQAENTVSMTTNLAWELVLPKSQ